MEQIIIEQPKQKPSTGVQLTALILGVVGFALSFGLYMGAIFRTVFTAVSMEYGEGGAYISGGIAGIMFCCLICALCLVAFILGVVGLVKSIRRETRTVKGIIFSALGLDFAVAGFVFAILSGVMAAITDYILPQVL